MSDARGSLDACVIAVHRSATHTMRKETEASLRLVEGLGVEGDAHAGVTVKHRSRVAKDPTQPNLRQVHLIASELHDELAGQGFTVAPGAMGENLTTRGLDLLALPTGTRLRIGAEALLEVTGLRNPCGQLNGVQEGLMAATRPLDAEGGVVRKAGIMAVVLRGGPVAVGDPIEVMLPEGPRRPLEPV